MYEVLLLRTPVKSMRTCHFDGKSLWDVTALQDLAKILRYPNSAPSFILAIRTYTHNLEYLDPSRTLAYYYGTLEWPIIGGASVLKFVPQNVRGVELPALTFTVVKKDIGTSWVTIPPQNKVVADLLYRELICKRRDA